MSNNYIEYKSKDNSKTLSVEEYLNKISPYLKAVINNLKKLDTWEIQLTTSINFISSKDDNDEERVKHLKSDTIEIMMNDEAALLRGIASKHHGDFYCLNCLYSFATENKSESHKKYLKIKFL